jgi:hypothetical protein
VCNHSGKYASHRQPSLNKRRRPFFSKNSSASSLSCTKIRTLLAIQRGRESTCCPLTFNLLTALVNFPALYFRF